MFILQDTGLAFWLQDGGLTLLMGDTGLTSLDMSLGKLIENVDLTWAKADSLCFKRLQLASALMRASHH